MDIKIVLAGGKKVNAIYEDGGKSIEIKTDQPKHLGGDGSAPSPFDIFLASIGTCTAMTVLSFCHERGIPTDGLKLIQHSERDGKSGLVGKITTEIQLPSGFPERYKEAVERAAGLCTVKKNIQVPSTFELYTSTGAANLVP